MILSPGLSKQYQGKDVHPWEGSHRLHTFLVSVTALERAAETSKLGLETQLYRWERKGGQPLVEEGGVNAGQLGLGFRRGICPTLPQSEGGVICGTSKVMIL